MLDAGTLRALAHPRPWVIEHTLDHLFILQVQDVTPAAAGYGGMTPQIWQMLALWDGRVIGHGAAVKKMSAKKMASEVTWFRSSQCSLERDVQIIRRCGHREEDGLRGNIHMSYTRG